MRSLHRRFLNVTVSMRRQEGRCHSPVSPPPLAPSNPYALSCQTELPSSKAFSGTIKPLFLLAPSSLCLIWDPCPPPQPVSCCSPLSRHALASALLLGQDNLLPQGLCTGGLLYLGASTTTPHCTARAPLLQISACLPLLGKASLTFRVKELLPQHIIKL